MISIKELMGLERILLEIETKFKFSLNFSDAYLLHTYLIEVGKITSYSFLIQDEFNEKFNDLDKLKEYHDKIMNSSIEFLEEKEIIEFIVKIEKLLNNEELTKLILNIGWW